MLPGLRPKPSREQRRWAATCVCSPGCWCSLGVGFMRLHMVWTVHTQPALPNPALLPDWSPAGWLQLMLPHTQLTQYARPEGVRDQNPPDKACGLTSLALISVPGNYWCHCHCCPCWCIYKARCNICYIHSDHISILIKVRFTACFSLSDERYYLMSSQILFCYKNVFSQWNEMTKMLLEEKKCSKISRAQMQYIILFVSCSTINPKYSVACLLIGWSQCEW